MTEDEFRNGPSRLQPLESFSDKPNMPDHINPLGLSDRDLEEARRLNAAMSNRAVLDDAYQPRSSPSAFSLGQELHRAAMMDRQEAAKERAFLRKTVRGPMVFIPDTDCGVWMHVDNIGGVLPNGGNVVVFERGQSGQASEWHAAITVDEVLERIERAAAMK